MLAFVVLVFFVFAMVLYLRRCISSVAQQYPEIADLSSALELLKADKRQLEQWLTDQKSELLKVQGERAEQDAIRQEILNLETRRKDLESAIEGLVAMQVETRELEAKMEDRRKELETLEGQIQDTLNKKEELPAVRAEYDRLQKALERKEKIAAAIHAGDARLQEQATRLSEQQSRLDKLSTEINPLEKRHAGLQQDLQTTEHELASLKNQLAADKTESSALNAQLPGLRKQAQDEQTACSNASARLDALKSQQAMLEDSCRKLEKEQDTAERDLASLQKQLAAAKAELEALNAQLPGLRKEVQSLGMQMAGGNPQKDTALEELMRDPVVSLVHHHFEETLNEKDMLEAFKRALYGARLQFPERTIKAFHTSLKCQDINPLTVLAGVSGTGKTLLPVKYAEFMGINQVILSVQPRWDSAQDLFGFYNYLERRYKATELSRCLLRMDPYHSDRFPNYDEVRSGLLMVLLDEMNLARPEYYFSEFLSKLELRRTVDPSRPDSRSRATIELDTGTGHGSLSIWVPENILFVGTMNEDESTQTLSDKVLDRANVLRFGKPEQRKVQNRPDMNALQQGAAVSCKVWEAWKKHDIQGSAQACSEWIKTLNDALAGIGRAFGFRVEEAIYRYVANYPGVHVQSNTQDMKLAFADQVEQKILPKLRGCDMAMDASNRSLEKIEGVINELEDNELLNAFRAAQENAKETGIFLWQGVTRS